MSTALFRFLGWTYLPDFAARQILRVGHRVYPTILRRAPPAPRTPAYVRHYRFTYAAVVLCYLVYNFFDASSNLPPNFYELLAVSPETSEGALKAAFRTFAKKYHPDRAGPEAEAFFIQVRDAFEALKDPVVRFAYDRFGPDVLLWTDCVTIRDYFRRGLLSSSGYHIVSTVILVLLSAIGKPSPISSWRYFLFIGLFAFELFLLVSPSPSTAGSSPFIDGASSEWTILSLLFPRRVVFQHVIFLHQVFFFLSIALSRVAPVLFPSIVRGDSTMDLDVMRGLAERVGVLAKASERELSIMLNQELHALHNSRLRAPADLFTPPPNLRRDLMDELKGEMANMMIEDKLGLEMGPVRSVWDAAVQREEVGVKDRPLFLPLSAS